VAFSLRAIVFTQTQIIMLAAADNIRISKFLSLILRHSPQTIGLTLDDEGWADVDELIGKANLHGVRLNYEVLQHVVKTNSKSRFFLDESTRRIRASQGHSINVDLKFEATVPPEILFHGTALKNVDNILKEGLQKRDRLHVHLSADKETAIKVGQRHGKPYVFNVAAGEMHRDGFSFFISENGVWLVDFVPSKYLLDSSEPSGRSALHLK
jgi:putative RNA 2'-phosphotransferase